MDVIQHISSKFNRGNSGRDVLHRLSSKFSRGSGSGLDALHRMTSTFSRASWMSGKSMSPTRLFLSNVLLHKQTEIAIGLVVVVNFGLIMRETDLKADDQDLPVWLQVSSWACFIIYCVELGIRVYVERCHILHNHWAWLDMLVVLSGALEQCLIMLGVTFFSVDFLRIFRCFRLVRICKALLVFKELQLLIRGCLACAKTLAWSMCLTFIFMSIWSVMAVELMHPVMKEVQENMSVWEDCERCSRSFATVMDSNLTLFQTVVAGDSWGRVAIPTIESHPWTAIIFVGSLFTIVFGMLNLIIAVLVDGAAEARARDTESRARYAEEEARQERKVLENIFKQIDVDSSGDVTFEELQQGAEEVPAFRDRLKVMAIDRSDLQQMFEMCDEDGSGEIDVHEFIETLYRLKCSDHAVSSTFVKHYVGHLEKNHRLLAEKVDEILLTMRDQFTGPLERRTAAFRNSETTEMHNFRSEDERAEAQNFRGEWSLLKERRAKRQSTFGSERSGCPRAPVSVGSRVFSEKSFGSAAKSFCSEATDTERDQVQPTSLSPKTPRPPMLVAAQQRARQQSKELNQIIATRGLPGGSDLVMDKQRSAQNVLAEPGCSDEGTLTTAASSTSTAVDKQKGAQSSLPEPRSSDEGAHAIAGKLITEPRGTGRLGVSVPCSPFCTPRPVPLPNVQPDALLTPK